MDLYNTLRSVNVAKLLYYVLLEYVLLGINKFAVYSFRLLSSDHD